MRNHWIFQALSPLSAGQQQRVSAALDQFLQKWNAHGTPVPGVYELRYERFLILTAPEGSTSGCSIDSMTREVTALMQRENIQRAEASLVFYKNTTGEIQAVDFREIPAAIAAGQLGPETTVFDITLNQTSDLQCWEVPLRETWMARYLPETSIK